VIEGSIDYDRLCTGNAVVMVGYLGDRGEFHRESQYYHAGDVISAEIGGSVQEYTILAVVGMPNSMMMSYSSGGYECLGFAEPVFLEKFPKMQQPVHCLFDAGEEAFDEINAQVSAIAESNGLSVQTKLTAEAEFKENPIYVQHGWNCNCIDTGGDRCAEPRQYDSDGGDRPSEGVCSYAQHWHDTKAATEADCL
jgi:putative ABC transport system permease protein